MQVNRPTGRRKSSGDGHVDQNADKRCESGVAQLEGNQEAEQYTWWSNRGESWAKNVGWRLDYQVITPALAPMVAGASIYKKARFSDHAPLIMDYNCELTDF